VVDATVAAGTFRFTSNATLTLGPRVVPFSRRSGAVDVARDSGAATGTIATEPHISNKQAALEQRVVEGRMWERIDDGPWHEQGFGVNSLLGVAGGSQRDVRGTLEEVLGPATWTYVGRDEGLDHYQTGRGVDEAMDLWLDERGRLVRLVVREVSGQGVNFEHDLRLDHFGETLDVLTEPPTQG
jgi:hypothetical protein